MIFEESTGEDRNRINEHIMGLLRSGSQEILLKASQQEFQLSPLVSFLLWNISRSDNSFASLSPRKPLVSYFLL